MIEVDSFVLRNIVHFNEARIPVKNNNGFVIISGLNKDSLIAEDQSNGAGKSLLWSALPNCIYAAAPSSTLKNTKKDMLDSSKSEIDIRMRNNRGQKVRVVQKPTKWHVYEENESKKLQDIKARTTSIQQAKIAEHFPITQEEFYAYTYLSSIQGQRLHFQVDKPAERLKFITSIFQLDAYDRLKKYFTMMLSRIKDEQTKFDVLESKLLNVNSQLERVNWSEDEAANAKQHKKDFKDLKTKRDALSRSISSANQLVGILRSLEKMIEKRDSLLEGFPAEKTTAEVISNLRKRKEIIRAYDTYRKQLASYERSTSRIREALEAIDVSGIPAISKLEKKQKKLERKKESLREQLSEASSTFEEHKRNSRVQKQILKRLDNLGYSSVDSVDVETDIEDDISICRTTIKLRKLLSSEEDSVCPTCLQDVDKHAIAKNVKKATKKLEALEKLSSARDFLRGYRDIEKETAKLGDIPDVGKLQSEYDKIKKTLKVITESLQLYAKKEGLESDLSNIEKPEAPGKKPPKTADLEALDEALQVCYDIDKANHAIDTTLSDNPDLIDAESNVSQYLAEAQEKKNSLERKLIKMDKKYQKLLKYTSEFDLRLGEYRILSKQRLELESEVSGIKPLLEKRDLYKALEKAYSAKGLKVAKANEIVRLLEANLNRYSNLIHAEPFTFNVYATEKGVFCDVDRGNGKTSDVRLLSGAESDSFRLLLMLSLLLMVPSERRTNFVVLDEPDSHMDKRTRTLFAERYIPFLREVVPHVFLITPHDHHMYSECDRWVVVKENGVSQLVTTGTIGE